MKAILFALLVVFLAVVRADPPAHLIESAKLRGFSWSNCGSSSDPIKLASLNLSPDPLVLGHNITLEFQVTIGTSVTSGTAHVTLEKKVGIWIEIPCVSNIGSCTYDNFCDLFNISKPCGPILEQYKIPCHCPFNSGTYTFPTTSFATKVPSNVPSWLTDGEYYAKGDLYVGSTRYGCYEVYVDLSVATFLKPLLNLN